MAAAVIPEPDHVLHPGGVNQDGNGFIGLTEGDGTDTAELSSHGGWSIDRWSRVDQPPAHGFTGAALVES